MGRIDSTLVANGSYAGIQLLAPHASDPASERPEDEEET